MISRIYDLKGNLVRLDSTTGSGYWRVDENGLFQFGHSYVGDCKIMSFETRLHVVAGGDYYLGPFSAVQIPNEALAILLEPIWRGKQALKLVQRNGVEIADGFETSLSLTGKQGDKDIEWIERRLVVRSMQHAKSANKAFEVRLTEAASEFSKLNEHGRGKEHFRDVESLAKAALAVAKKHKVEGCFRLTYAEQVTEYPVRVYKDRPARVRVECEVRLGFERDEEAIEKVARLFGWRVYGTNQPAKDFSLEQLVCAYCNEFLVERNFGRFKGKSLALTPMYLQDDGHATGLIRLLSIGLRALTLLEHVARRSLAKNGRKLAGVYAGNPKRETATPRAETLLRVFKNIYLTTIQIAGQTHQNIMPLTDVQKQILEICELPATLYDLLVPNLQNSP